jgi:hypothetical protein
MEKVTGRCSNKNCQAHVTGKCYEGKDSLDSCQNWKTKSITTKNKERKSETSTAIIWTGEALTPDTLNIISQRSNPIIVASVGNVDAGKTSYLAMLYILLLNGHKLDDYRFSGSLTLTAWDRLADKLRYNRGTVEFPAPTPSNPDYYNLLHLALKKDSKLHDVILADVSGEVFKLWADNKDDENAENARWIHKNASAFLLFVDCEALETRKAVARGEILDIANRLVQDLGKRPVAVVWSKADRIGNVHYKLKELIKEQLRKIFQNNYSEFEVTNYPNIDQDELCHGNNLKTLNWLLNCSTQPSDVVPVLEILNKDDIFLNYK